MLNLSNIAVFDFKTSIPITRHNRAYMRYLQRKKATFEVYHKRYSYGFLPRPLFLGKVTVDMSQLLNNASTGGVLEVGDKIVTELDHQSINSLWTSS